MVDTPPAVGAVPAPNCPTFAGVSAQVTAAVVVVPVASAWRFELPPLDTLLGLAESVTITLGEGVAAAVHTARQASIAAREIFPVRRLKVTSIPLS